MPAIDTLAAIAKDPRAQSVLGGAIAAALTVAALSPSASDAPNASLGDALAKGGGVREQRADNLDTAALHEVSRAIRDADPQLVDIGGQLVEPGAETTAGVNLPRGVRLVDFADECARAPSGDALGLGGAYAASACVIGPAVSSWAVLGSTCEDRGESTWCEVRLRNGATDAQRALVWVRWERP